MEFLIKTFKDSDLQFAKNLLQYGDLFFQHVSVYRKIEDNNIRGDIDEGNVLETYEINIPSNIKTLTIRNENGGKTFIADLEIARKNIPDLREQDIQSIQIKYIVDWLLYCMTYINSEMKNQNEIIEKLQNLGKYCVIIKYSDFIAKVNAAIKCEQGLVRYSDISKKRDDISCRIWYNAYNLYCTHTNYDFVYSIVNCQATHKIILSV